ncbi:MAG: amidase, partial [Acidiphilium sp. 37-67-22]
MTELWHLTASDLAGRIRRREVSAREAAAAALSRLDAANPTINAVIDHRPEQALAAAERIDEAFARGDDPGPLAGVPVTVKVNIDQKGFATTNGIRLQKDLIAQSSSPVVDNLERAGAVIIGRTNTPAFSMRWFTTNLLHGDTRGSSGGAAAAVASGIGAFAHGTDIAGSIRYPAYACGLHGLRPSIGRVPAFNASGPERGIGAQITAVSGPIGRSMADLRLALAAMAQPDADPDGPRDPWWCPAPLEGPDLPRRAALCLRPGGMKVVPEVEAALIAAGRALESAGWTVETIDDLPHMREAVEVQIQLWLGDGFDTLASTVAQEGDPGAMTVIGSFRAQAKSWPGDVVAQALKRRATIARAWRQLLARFPVLMMPTSGELPFREGLD